jgi:hypothetical protein
MSSPVEPVEPPDGSGLVRGPWPSVQFPSATDDPFGSATRGRGLASTAGREANRRSVPSSFDPHAVALENLQHLRGRRLADGGEHLTGSLTVTGWRPAASCRPPHGRPRAIASWRVPIAAHGDVELCVGTDLGLLPLSSFVGRALGALCGAVGASAFRAPRPASGRRRKVLNSLRFRSIGGVHSGRHGTPLERFHDWAGEPSALLWAGETRSGTLRRQEETSACSRRKPTRKPW